MKKYWFLFIACVVYSAVVNAQDVQKDMRYVDLGLPSGILWAEENEPGVYTFEETVEKFRGKDMPGMEEFRELVDICTWTWNGTGYTIVGPSGDSILLPLLPIKDCQGHMENNPTTGRYWSAEVYDELEGWGLYFDKDKVWTAVLFDADNQGYMYVKRFLMEATKRHQNWFSENPESQLLLLSDRPYPRIRVNFGGNDAFRTPMEIELEQFVGVKGFKARGKRVTTWTVDFIEELEPTRFPEPEEQDEPAETVEEKEDEPLVETPPSEESGDEQENMDSNTQLSLFPDEE